jgi:hypothetical protein
VQTASRAHDHASRHAIGHLIAFVEANERAFFTLPGALIRGH